MILFYLDARNKYNEALSKLSGLLNKVHEREILESVTDLLSSENPTNILASTFIYVVLSPEGSQCFRVNLPSKEWSEMCVHLNERNAAHGDVKSADKFLLRLPGSNGYTERVFSHTNYYIWSEAGSRFPVDKLQAILAAKSNANFSREAFRENLASNRNRYIPQINIIPQKVPTPQNDQGTLKIITSYIINYYIITFSV
jgi:hypothetical protein